MIKGSEKRTADHPIDNLFLDRWSPRAMSGEAIPQEELMVLFEAARWAPSSYNNQPWRILYARRDSEHWPLFLGLRTALNISEGFQVEAMAAIGKPTDPATLSEELREKEAPSDRRKLEQTICEGPFCF